MREAGERSDERVVPARATVPVVQPPAPTAVDAILTLQRGAGNAVVSRHVERLQVARAPQPQAPPKRAPKGQTEVVDTEATYNNFLGALSRVITTKGGSHGDWEMTDEQEQLVVSTRRVLQLGYDRQDWRAALTLWESVSQRFAGELRIAREVGVPAALVDGAAAQLKWVTSTVEGGAYHEAHREGLAGNKFEQPDMVLAEAKFKRAEQRYMQSQWFVEKSAPLVADAAGMTQDVGKNAGLGKAVADIVMLPGSIADKLEYAKKNGVVAKTATAIDLVNVVLDAADNTVKVYSTTVARVFRWKQTAAAAKNMAKEAEAFGVGAEAFEKYADSLDKLGKAANVLAIVAEGIKIVDALSKDPPDWDAVVESGLEIGLNVAEFGLGADAGAPILVIALVVRAEIEILRMVSDQIKWAKRETARGAAADFIGVAAKIAKRQASDFIADCELAVNAPEPTVREIATKKVLDGAPKLVKSLRVLHSHYDRSAKDSIGGYPDMVAALGSDAMRIFNSPAPPEDPLNVMQQCETIFAAANSLARHVQTAYKD